MTSALTQRHRAQQLLLRRATQRDAPRVFSLLDGDRLDATYPAFATAAATLVAANRQTSAGLAAGYLRQERRAQGVSGAAKIVLARPIEPEALATSLRVTSVIVVKKATADGVATDVAMRNALTMTSGALARMVLNAGRETVTASVAADPRGVGYERVLGGGGCEFCQMLAGRGGVYSAETADFEAHDHCGCTAEPVYRA